jgi:sugar lactone lactonase YvrE
MTAGEAFGVLRGKFEQNAKAVSESTLVFKLPSADLIAEDIAYDPATKRFFISSVHERKILVCDVSGACKDFIRSSDVKPPLWAVLAVRADPARKVLWATTASMNMEADHVAVEDGRSAVLKFDMQSGKLLKRYETSDQVKRAFGDMTVSSRGDAYVSDGLSGDVFVIAHDHDQLERLLPEGTFVSPQTPALSADEQTLFVPDYAIGIARVDLKTKAVTWLESDVPAATDGIDGLYWNAGWLVGVQNGTEPERLAAFHLNAQNRVDRVQLLEANSPGLGDPTHGVAVGVEFYFIANSGWDRVDDDGKIKPGQAAEIRRMMFPR